MEPLRGRIRTYAWGSRSALATLTGRPAPSPEPEAELWLGAHPASPAALQRAAGQIPLTEVIGADPETVLGPGTVARFGQRLPYLLKVLAAAEPLSLQAHPDAGQAAAGFAGEEQLGIPLDAPERTYVDPYHKPELLIAIGPFDALCGFRDPIASADLIAALRVSELAGVVRALRIADPGVALRTAVTELLTMPIELRAGLVKAVVAGAAPLAAEHPTYQLAGRLADRYPEDSGVIVAMLLNRVLLAPGEGVWMPAGNLHAYLEGVGVEIMAASDNVLRGGLTPKQVNVAELLRVLRFEALADPVVRPVPVAPGVVEWPVPIPDFALVRAVVSGPGGPVELPGSGPRIVLRLAADEVAGRELTAGRVAGRELTVDDGAGAVRLAPGEAAFAAAGAGRVTVTGQGTVYQASVKS